MKTISHIQFMRGKARVIVDTVAFDLSINKADITRTLCAENWQSRPRWKERNGNSTGYFKLCPIAVILGTLQWHDIVSDKVPVSDIPRKGTVLCG